MSTPQQVLTAALSAINGEASVPAVDFDLVDDETEYIGVMLTRRFGGVQRGCGTKATVGYRLVVVAVSQTSAKNVRVSLEESRRALEYVRLGVSDSTSTPIQFETETATGTKDGWTEGRQFYNFVI